MYENKKLNTQSNKYTTKTTRHRKNKTTQLRVKIMKNSRRQLSVSLLISFDEVPCEIKIIKENEPHVQ